MEQVSIKSTERIDDLQRAGLKIIQDPARFCFGMDAVLLSYFAACPDGGEVLDLGTGTGILPILMSAKTGAAHLTGLEIQHESAEMAARSALHKSTPCVATLPARLLMRSTQATWAQPLS